MEDMNNTINPDQPVIQPTETPPIQPTETPITLEPNTKLNIFKYLFIICFILLLVSVTYSVKIISKLNPTEPNITEVIPTAIPTQEVINEVTPTSSPIEDWKTYTSKEIGFSFKYPPQLKFADPKIDDGNTILTISSILQSLQNIETFVNSVNIGITFAGGRGGSFVDAAPYIKSGNNITYGYNHDNVDPRNIRKIYTNPNGVEIVVINDTSKFSEGGENEPDYNDFTKYGLTGALINTKNKIYPGLTLEVNSVIKEADFFIILDTIKLN